MPPVLIFSGHRIDAPGRPAPRFPVGRVPQVTDWLAARIPAGAVCLSSLADGGDILFAEAARAAGCPHHIVLPMAPDRFAETSVSATAPGNWRARFDAIWSTTPPDCRHILSDPGPNPFDACNRDLIARALARPGPARLLVLWDGTPGRPGGTGSMVALAWDAGLPVEICAPTEDRPA